ncbi:Eco57I restriction-modification methylase domain-containing protein [Variovorax sp. DXTD-1]|uniref:Eco57I restriction-modification methylase domain-containing protein n=1 Tax=Variovorax sp. DXTD-1 TaxID=2495592 RepID=UPI00163C8538|nr:N-6 DNA methylase [Variovorax sp. DXTD-1]
MAHTLIPASSTVYTPQALAHAMVEAANDGQRCVWLDPCLGDGAFVAEMAALGIAKDHILALDISVKSSQKDAMALTERGVDFIAWAKGHASSVDRVVMNPPYVGLSKIKGAPLEQALQVSLPQGDRLTRRSNYWCAFILRAIECLRPGGHLVAVLPAAWDYAIYARPIQEAVYRAFGLVGVVRCSKPLFSTVQEGTVVLVARNRGAPESTRVRVEVSDLQETIDALRVLGAGGRPSSAAVVHALPAQPSSFRRLDELMNIRIGAVTGDSKYFLLSEQERATNNLPVGACTPVLTRARHLTSAFMDRSAWERLRDRGERVWLFRPTPTTQAHAAVIRYLQRGLDGSCNVQAHKVRSRDPWHRTPLPPKADGFISGTAGGLPFLVLKEMKGLSATNTLYVVSFSRRVELSERAAIGILLLTSSVRRQLVDGARIYADGLRKFEPSDLGRIRIPVVSKLSENTADVFKSVCERAATGRIEEAQRIADQWLTENLREPEALPLRLPCRSAA